ncbi:MAG: hypothetical protein M3O09_08300 [Acidobacteriota bacterium]|nr:hypothetical protein [Acidobacteriota bacterium]
MSHSRITRHSLLFRLFQILAVATLGLCASFVQAQTCFTSNDMDQPTRTALTNAGKRYFDMTARGDAASLRQNSIASVASDFSGIENAVKENQANFSGVQPNLRSPFLLKAEGSAPLTKAEFLCGVFNANGQTSDSAEFVIPNLPPGNYAIVTLDLPTAKGPYTLSFVLQQVANDWKLGGFYVNAAINGHDGKWFLEHARAFRDKGQKQNSWFYFIQARALLSPVPFMYTQATDKLYDESQSVKPTTLPVSGTTADLVADGKTYKLISVAPLAVGKDFDLLVRFQSADVSNTTQAFQDDMAVMKALLAKFPEFRDAFDGVVARAVEPSGRDYGALLAMKDIK